MKIIVVRSRGYNLSFAIGRKTLMLALTLGLSSLVAGVWYVQNSTTQVNDAVVEQWRTKLSEQRDKVVDLARMNQAQSEAIGRQLAQMQARLFRMEAMGEQIRDAADLEATEFNFNDAPAQGGPELGQQAVLDWHDLASELDALSSRLKRRETELEILNSVLADEDIQQSSTLNGRPVKWGWLSSPYGQRVDPITGKTAFHSGVDFAGRHGSDVIAVASGVVTFAGDRSGYGKIVEISHANGLTTRYAHHKDLVVATGDVVKKGEVVGIMGSSGRSTGPHVHFEVLKNGRTVNPAQFLTN